MKARITKFHLRRVSISKARMLPVPRVLVENLRTSNNIYQQVQPGFIKPTTTRNYTSCPPSKCPYHLSSSSELTTTSPTSRVRSCEQISLLTAFPPPCQSPESLTPGRISLRCHLYRKDWHFRRAGVKHQVRLTAEMESPLITRM